jgi:CBS domain-containing protein
MIVSKEIMSFPLITINSGSFPSEAADLMLKHKVRHLVVVSKKIASSSNNDDNNMEKSVGIITPLDFTRHQADRIIGIKDNNIQRMLDYYRD